MCDQYLNNVSTFFHLGSANPPTLTGSLGLRRDGNQTTAMAVPSTSSALLMKAMLIPAQVQCGKQVQNNVTIV